MIKIFHKDRCLNLSVSAPKNSTLENFEIIDYQSVKSLKGSYHSFLKKTGLVNFTFVGGNEIDLWKSFQQLFKPIEAAGGLVFNQEGKLLMIYRLDTWDLPKGKIEKGESVKSAAVREVVEECGIGNLEITKDLGVTYHAYELKQEWILKTTHWFEMKYHGDSSKLVPQLEENITQAEWLDKQGVSNALENTYPLIKEIIGRSEGN